LVPIPNDDDDDGDSSDSSDSDDVPSVVDGNNLPSTISSLSSDSYGDDGGDSSDSSEGHDFDNDGNNMIGNMSIFNTKMNDLYVFFKGKIKPNLKIISKNEIQEMYDDMNVLKQNFDDVYKLIDDDYADIFAIDKSHQNKKVDDFLAMFKKNFDKPYSDIIYNLKAYSSIGDSSTGNTIIRVPTIGDTYLGSTNNYENLDRSNGGMLLTHATRKNMYRNKKYLL
jgi:hypothetical protein